MEKANIIIVEDEAIICMELEANLKAIGYDVVVTASRGEDAIIKAEQFRPDLILMDIKLKGEMDGIEAAGIIKERFNIPLVYLTAHLDEDQLKRSKLTMPFGYILKPVQERYLKVTIEMALYVAKAEEAQKENGEKYKEFVEKSADGYIITDKDLNITDFKLAEEIKGNVIGQNLLDFSPDIKSSGQYDKYLEVLKTGKPVDINDVRFQEKFGKDHYQIKVFKLGEGLGFFAREI
jgi:CheY-like chemotaxis protein